MGSDVDEAWARRDADEFEHNALMRGRASALDRAADIIRRAAPQGGRVLDVGCGVGLLGEKLGDLDVVGVVFFDPLLRRAKSRLGAVRGSVFAVPVADHSVDVVACLFVLDDYDRANKYAAIAELVRSVAPGGTLIVGAYAPDDERMGPRRSEVSAAPLPVHLEDERFYREALERACGASTAETEHVRSVVPFHGISRPMARHFILTSVVAPQHLNR